MSTPSFERGVESMTAMPRLQNAGIRAKVMKLW